MSRIAALTAATNADELKIVESQEVWATPNSDAVALKIA
jgi:hypothetical protein